jgi:hypothetical protein
MKKLSKLMLAGIILAGLLVPAFGQADTAPSFFTGKDTYGYFYRLGVLTDTMTFRWCPAGTFYMGADSACSAWLDGQPNAHKDASGKWADTYWTGRFIAFGPRHAVRLTKGFYMQDISMTSTLYNVFATAAHQTTISGTYANLAPDMANMVCTWFKSQGGSRIPDKNYLLRRPTNAEWEYASVAGAPDTLVYDTMLGCDAYSPKTLWPANRWGIYDMFGPGAATNMVADAYNVDDYTHSTFVNPYTTVTQGGACTECDGSSGQQRLPNFNSHHCGSGTLGWYTSVARFPLISYFNTGLRFTIGLDPAKLAPVDTGSITVKVRDSLTGKTIIGAKIKLMKEGWAVRTVATVNASFPKLSNLDTGTFDIEASHPLYNSKTVTATVVKTTLNAFDILLLAKDGSGVLADESVLPSVSAVVAKPNPFNAATHITYTLMGKLNSANVSIFSVDGRNLAQFALNRNHGSLVWNAGALPAGMYLIKLQNGNRSVAVKKMILLK